MDDKAQLRKIIAAVEHTLLRQNITEAMLKEHCAQAARYGFAAAVVQPAQVARAAALLAGTGVRVVTVAGFPFGEELTEVKALSARLSAAAGADEVDMVMRISAAKQGDWEEVTRDIAGVAAAAGVPVKVILETGLLTPEQISRAVRCCVEGGAAFAKTSTGYFGGGATVEAVRLMKRAAAGRLQIKASGGIRSYADALAMLEAGAERLGTSAGVAIARGDSAGGEY